MSAGGCRVLAACSSVRSPPRRPSATTTTTTTAHHARIHVLDERCDVREGRGAVLPAEGDGDEGVVRHVHADLYFERTADNGQKTGEGGGLVVSVSARGGRVEGLQREGRARCRGGAAPLPPSLSPLVLAPRP